MNKLYHSRIFELSDMIRQIAEMWNLNNPGRGYNQLGGSLKCVNIITF
jgi:hypothetical protein